MKRPVPIICLFSVLFLLFTGCDSLNQTESPSVFGNTGTLATFKNAPSAFWYGTLNGVTQGIMRIDANSSLLHSTNGSEWKVSLKNGNNSTRNLSSFALLNDRLYAVVMDEAAQNDNYLLVYTEDGSSWKQAAAFQVPDNSYITSLIAYNNALWLSNLNTNYLMYHFTFDDSGTIDSKNVLLSDSNNITDGFLCVYNNVLCLYTDSGYVTDFYIWDDDSEKFVLKKAGLSRCQSSTIYNGQLILAGTSGYLNCTSDLENFTTVRVQNSSTTVCDTFIKSVCGTPDALFICFSASSQDDQTYYSETLYSTGDLSSFSRYTKYKLTQYQPLSVYYSSLNEKKYVLARDSTLKNGTSGYGLLISIQ